MKNAVLLALLSLFVFGCEKADLNSDKGKYSYAIGHQIGKNMKGQGVELDSKAFAQAVKDVMAGKDSALTEDEMREAMKNMTEGIRAKEEEKATANKKVGEDYLAANKDKEGVKTTASGLQYKVITEGKGPKPKDSDIVEVHYKGTLIDGTEFDSSYKRNKPAEFPLKAVIPGWTEALQLMTVGSKYQLFIPPNLAYGERGNPTIPGNSVLVFDVELLSIKKNDSKKK